MQKRCARNRKRSKRRAIFCPTHGCYLDSSSQKYSLYTESADVLRSRGLSRFAALTLVATHTTILLTGEWLEKFWCPECEDVQWYHVKRVGDRDYELHRAPQALWLQATGVINPGGNPSVSEFTRRQARAQAKMRDFAAVQS
ncbi:MAG: hypothetical protein AAGG51_07520 [Cyanobacteria bacterium P01_G01_bin.54]